MVGVVQSSSNLQQLLGESLHRARLLLGKGKVFDSIPSLAQVCPQRMGIAVYSVQQELLTVGDAYTPFSIQSLSKLFSLTLALQYEADTLWRRVGREPSGHLFNTLIQLDAESGIPRNPFINAGAILLCDILASSNSSMPTDAMLRLLRRLSGNQTIQANTTVAIEEYDRGDRHRAMAYLMKSFDNFDNDVSRVLAAYFHHCAIEMNCVDLARACIFLANRGRCPASGKEILNPEQTRQFNALMTTCGLYNGAGEFAYRVGLPAKSGVGGGIVAIVPDKMSICVFAPELDQHGNSLAGIRMLEYLAQSLGQSIF